MHENILKSANENILKNAGHNIQAYQRQEAQLSLR